MVRAKLYRKYEPHGSAVLVRNPNNIYVYRIGHEIRIGLESYGSARGERVFFLIRVYSMVTISGVNYASPCSINLSPYPDIYRYTDASINGAKIKGD